MRYNTLTGRVESTLHYLHEKTVFEGSEQWMGEERLLYRFDLGDRERKRGNETGAGEEMTVTPAQSDAMWNM